MPAAVDKARNVLRMRSAPQHDPDYMAVDRKSMDDADIAESTCSALVHFISSRSPSNVKLQIKHRDIIALVN